MHRAWNGFDVLENPTGNSADPRSTRGMSTRGTRPAGSPDGPNSRPQAALYHQPRAYAANPGTAAREHAIWEVGRGNKRHTPQEADSMRLRAGLQEPGAS